MISLVIVTGATGAPALRRNLESVARLRPDPRIRAEHWIVVDGPEFADSVRAALDQVPDSPVATRRVVQLPFNTGRDGGAYLCHRVIAACAFMVPTGWWTSTLDEDNALAPGHLAAVAEAMARVPDARWGYTLRTVVGPGGDRLDDTAESMGLVRLTKLGYPDRLVDTNCYCFSSSLAKELAPLWGCTTARNPDDVEADRKVIQTLALHEPRAWCTRQCTVEYHTDNRPDSVRLDFFRDAAPWSPDKRDLYVFHFDRDKTRDLVALVARGDRADPLGEWCMTMLDGLRDAYNIIDGFENIDGLPHDALCLVAICHPGTLPLDRLRQMKATTHPAMRRLLYTAEGPNRRHQAQWTKAFLKEAADAVLTHARFVLDDPEIETVACPHNARFFDETALDATMRDNAGPGTGTAAVVLEPRPGTDAYHIDGHAFRCLDGVRRMLADGFGDTLTVSGRGWRGIVKDGGGRVLYDGPRHLDTRTSVDVYQTADYGLVVENTDALGYVSEKVQDVLVAGAVPVYDGRSVDPATVQGKMLEEGRGRWWIDIRDLVDRALAGGGDGLGGMVRARLDSIAPDQLREMKQRVRDVRREYALATGCRAVREAVAGGST